VDNDTPVIIAMAVSSKWLVFMMVSCIFGFEKAASKLLLKRAC